MRFSLKAFLLILALAVTASAFFLNSLLSRIAGSEEFRHFAEQKVGEYLKAKVNIGEIRTNHFNQIVLEKIIIELPLVQDGSQLIHVDRLFFRYRLDQIWKRHFDAPIGLVLKNPTILIDQNQFPYRYFENIQTNSAGFAIPSLDFKGGEIRYSLSSLKQEILLTDMEGKMTPSLDQTVQVDVRARVSGFLKGSVRIRGMIHPNKKNHDLTLEVENMSFTRDIPIPLAGIEGKIRWVNQDLFFDGLQASLHGWQTILSGSFLNHDGQPGIVLHMRLGKMAPWIKFDFAMDLFKKKFDGTLQPSNKQPVHFSGKVYREGKRFCVESFSVEPGYEGKGELDFLTGNYELIFEKGNKRLAVHSNLRGLEFVIYFHLDHWRILDLDLVTQGKLFLRTLSSNWRSKEFLFKGNFETDYFILERQPFKDLKGSFELNPYGVTGLRASWGKAFQMTGQVFFPWKKPQVKCLLRVSDFDLGLVYEFASKPMPKELGGILDGKLSLEGELNKPEVVGIFNVRDGRWGQLYYDRGIIQFRGFPPYLPVEGSKIMKGRTTFFLKGAIDLKLDNVFAGVKIETPDHLVIWKGLEATLHEKDGSLEVNASKLGSWGEFSILEAREQKGSSAYDQEKTKNSQTEEHSVQFGPTLKF